MKTSVDKLIFASVFAVPMASVIPMPGTIVWYPQFLALLIIGLALVSAQLYGFNKGIALFTLYCLFSYIFICKTNPRAMLCLMSVYAAAYVIYATSLIKNVSAVYKAIALFSIIQLAYIILQKLNIDPIFSYFDYKNMIAHAGTADVVGFLGSHNQVGAYYAIVSQILFSINPWLILVSIIPIVLTKCTTALAAVLVATILNLYLNNKKNISGIALALALIISGFWFKYDDVNMQRFQLLNFTLRQHNLGEATVLVAKDDAKTIKSNPWFGFGLGTFIQISPSSQKLFLFNKPNEDFAYEHAHNDLLEALFELGRVGFLIIFMIALGVWVDFKSNARSKRLTTAFCSLIAMAVVSMGIYVFQAPVSLFMACLVLGLFYKEVSNARNCIQKT